MTDHPCEALTLVGQYAEQLTAAEAEIKRLRRLYAVDLAAIMTEVSHIADDADARLADEYADRQLVLEHTIDRLRAVAGVQRSSEPHEVYATANRHHAHEHFRDDVVAGRDWMPGAVECDRAAAGAVTS